MKTKTEHRIICPNYGTGHRTHAHTKKGMSLMEAAERAEAQDDHYRDLCIPGSAELPYFRQEIGWKIQSRTVTEWENIE